MSFTYLDTSAIAKLFKSEPETITLRKYLGRDLITSGVSRLEVKRVIDRNPDLYEKAAMKVLDNFQFMELDSSIIAIAESFRAMPYLRSLDALHLATALYMKPVITEFITDDNHLARAAEFSGFLVTAPA